MSELDAMLARVRIDLANREAAVPLRDVALAAKRQLPPLPAEAILRTGNGVKVIAEVKPDSRTTGVGDPISDLAALAEDYAAGGAAWIGVPWQWCRFGGAPDCLLAVKARVDVPVLSKDLVISGYQIVEARAAGADAVLLLASALNQPALVSLVERVHSLGMCAVVEVCGPDELARAVDAGTGVIGINAGDRGTRAVNHERFSRMARLVPEGCLTLAVSGVQRPRDVLRLAAHGANAALVGEALLRTGSPKSSVRSFVAAGAHPAVYRR